MATGGQSHDEVKRICTALECSPSATDNGAPFRNHPSITVGGTAANGGKKALATPESSFDSFNYNRGGKIAGYSGKFARGARKE